MSWSCRRPGCGREAEVCITYDAVACQVWLDPISVSPAGGQPLCAAHAQGLRAPRGWVVLDRRTSQASLMTPAVEPPPRPAARPRIARAWGQFEAPRLEFVGDADSSAPGPVPAVVVTAPPVIEEPEPAPEPAPEPEPEPEPVPVPEPVPEPEPAPAAAAATEKLLQPKGRLLSRAFEATGYQRSAITQTARPEDPDGSR